MWLTHGILMLCSSTAKLHAGLELELCTGSQSKIQHRIAELIPKGGAAFAQLVCHPDLMALLSQYLGHNFRCATFSSNTLLPQGNLRSDLMHGHSQASTPISMSCLTTMTMHGQCSHPATSYAQHCTDHMSHGQARGYH